ncbi:MAG: hypothetical protein F4Y97_03535 [Dehalococcoidia bacterium]|nr:hypothetical protein [Dehalococcoidia bacterium]
MATRDTETTSKPENPYPRIAALLHTIAEELLLARTGESHPEGHTIHDLPERIQRLEYDYDRRLGDGTMEIE